MSLACTYSANQQNILLDCPAGLPDFWSSAAHLVVQIVLGIIVIIIVVSLLRSMVRVADQWDRAVILRLGRFSRVAGPGLFFKVPFIDKIAEWVSVQVEVVSITADQSLTRDTVPVDVKAVVFYKVVDPRAAVVEVADYAKSVSTLSQVSLRESIGANDLSQLLSEREKLDTAIKEAVQRKSQDWGIEVIGVEIRDVEIPDELQDAMSREAQAEREKKARIILGQSEVEIAEKFVAAAKVYERNPIALQLRSMNIIYETTKERGSTILLPSTLVDSLGSAAIATAIANARPSIEAGETGEDRGAPRPE